MCQKARLIVQKGDDSVTPSETSGSRAGAPTATSGSTVLRTSRGDFDLLHIQDMLSRNPEIAKVVSIVSLCFIPIHRTRCSSLTSPHLRIGLLKLGLLSRPGFCQLSNDMQLQRLPPSPWASYSSTSVLQG